MPYDSGGGYSTPRRTPRQPSEVDQILSQIPLINGWSGANQRIQNEQDLSTADQNRAYWDSLNAPTAGDLTPQYDPADRAAQQGALTQLQEWGRGGLTAADRGMMEATRRRDEQGVASQRGAIDQQAQARGMGGSGLDYATQMQASQTGQQQASDAESQMMASAQQRALSAIQAQGQLGTAMRGQGQHEAEAVPGAIQQSYEDASSRAAGATGQYSQDASTRQQGRDRQQDSNDSLLGFLSDL